MAWEGCCEAEHTRMQNRPADEIGFRQQLIVEPKDGRIPFHAGRLAVKAGNVRSHSHSEQ